MAYTQIITVQGAEEQALRDHIAAWHEEQGSDAPGYLGSRLLADADRDDTYVVEVDFRSEEEAARNNDRPQTQQWASQLKELTSGEPTYRNLREVYATSQGG